MRYRSPLWVTSFPLLTLIFSPASSYAIPAFSRQYGTPPGARIGAVCHQAYS